MKLVSYTQDGTPRVGALTETNGNVQIVDLVSSDPSIPARMNDFLAGGDVVLDKARAALTEARHTVDFEDVNLLSPIPAPGKIICIGLNYADHAQEQGAAIPEYPEVFSKFSNAVIGPGEPIVLPAVSDKVDYEAELAVVIGTRARNIPEDDAMEYVAGYVPFNDVSARDYQLRTTQWTLGKSFDTFAPMGPALVTADEITDPHTLDIRAVVNGKTLQSSNTRQLIFRIPELIAELTSVVTLDPGDVIATGTPAGVGLFRDPPRFLQPGDIVQIEIAGLGVLRNPVVGESQHDRTHRESPKASRPGGGAHGRA